MFVSLKAYTGTLFFFLFLESISRKPPSTDKKSRFPVLCVVVGLNLCGWVIILRVRGFFFVKFFVSKKPILEFFFNYVLGWLSSKEPRKSVTT